MTTGTTLLARASCLAQTRKRILAEVETERDDLLTRLEAASGFLDLDTEVEEEGDLLVVGSRGEESACEV